MRDGWCCAVLGIADLWIPRRLHLPPRANGSVSLAIGPDLITSRQERSLGRLADEPHQVRHSARDQHATEANRPACGGGAGKYELSPVDVESAQDGTANKRTAANGRTCGETTSRELYCRFRSTSCRCRSQATPSSLGGTSRVFRFRLLQRLRHRETRLTGPLTVELVVARHAARVVSWTCCQHQRDRVLDKSTSHQVGKHQMHHRVSGNGFPLHRLLAAFATVVSADRSIHPRVHNLRRISADARGQEMSRRASHHS